MSSQIQRHDKPSYSMRQLLFLLAGFVALGLIAWSAVYVYRAAQQLAAEIEFVEPDFLVDEPAGTLTETIIDDPGPLPTAEIAPLISTDALQPWSGAERINILLMGSDRRCADIGPTRTDSMIVVTIDPIGKTAGAVSLPRDLWVEIPSIGVDRISQAHYIGELREYPGGGTALAVETVGATLGINIQYFAEINFDAFIDFIDLIGGITIDVAETISDPNYPDRCYGYDPFYVEAGQHVLNGESALKYARTRATIGGDVDRAERQQQVGLAIRDTILDANQLPQLISQAPLLWQSFQSNVRTNMTLTEAIQLALLAQDIPRSSIQTAVIGFDYVYLETTPDGEQVLVPLRDNIRALRDELFYPPAIPTPTVADIAEKIAAENARVAIYNGTPTFGLAAETESFLLDLDINVVEIGNADSAAYPKTRIIDYGSHPNTTLYLSQLMHVPPLNVSSESDPEGSFDVLIILGSDWEIPVP